MAISIPVGVEETLRLERVRRRVWDVTVVGAGPAGTMAARETARLGCSVLLIDKAPFPRPKVCGCCLNGAALAALGRVNLEDLPNRYGAKPLRSLRLASGGQQALIPLPTGAALSRERLDLALVEEATASGVVFLPQTHAVLGSAEAESRRLILRNGSESAEVETRVVLAATGLSETFPILSKEESSWTVACASRVGVGTVTTEAPDFYEDHSIFMACGENGYVGLVRLEDHRLNIAAAVDPSLIRAAGGPGRAAEIILRQAGFPAIQDLTKLPWVGTPSLSRSRLRPAGERLFFLGDAASYVEPFTGEGIGWAFTSGLAAAPLAAQAAQRWDPSLAKRWEQFLHRRIYPRQSICRGIQSALRSPFLTRTAVGILSRFPQLAKPIMQRVNAEI